MHFIFYFYIFSFSSIEIHFLTPLSTLWELYIFILLTSWSPISFPHSCFPSQKKTKPSKQANKGKNKKTLQTKSKQNQQLKQKNLFDSPLFLVLQHLFIYPGGIGNYVMHCAPLHHSFPGKCLLQ